MARKPGAGDQHIDDLAGREPAVVIDEFKIRKRRQSASGSLGTPAIACQNDEAANIVSQTRVANK
ncbi:MAG: hypothetical protein NXH88_16535 [Hyphomonas sp.]|nr:hypothetical protein [Hyphomonas sp.]